MTSKNAQKALVLLRPVGKSMALISELPGLEPVDYALLRQLAGSAMLLARRMDARAQGLNLARISEELQRAAELVCAEPITERVQ